MGNVFPRFAKHPEGNVVAELEIDFRGGWFLVSSNKQTVAEIQDSEELARAIVDQFVQVLRVRRGHSWFDGMLLEQRDRCVLLVGDWFGGDVPAATALADAGWTLLADTAVPVESSTAEASIFAQCTPLPQVQNAGPHKLSAIVYCSLHLHTRHSLFALPPGCITIPHYRFLCFSEC